MQRLHLPNVTFEFTSQDLVLPNVITFVVGGPNTTSNGPLSGLTPNIGSAPNSMWYGSAPGNFSQNDTWAIADGAHNNYLESQFNVVATPEPGFYGLMALGLGALAAARCRKNS
jgi:hypothetical protein